MLWLNFDFHFNSQNLYYDGAAYITINNVTKCLKNNAVEKIWYASNLSQINISNQTLGPIVTPLANGA